MFLNKKLIVYIYIYVEKEFWEDNNYLIIVLMVHEQTPAEQYKSCIHENCHITMFTKTRCSKLFLIMSVTRFTVQ